MSAREPLAGGPEQEAGMSEHSWLYDHIGRLAGILLGLVMFAFLAFLAVAGYHPAVYLMVLVVAFFGMIALGGQLRGGR